MTVTRDDVLHDRVRQRLLAHPVESRHLLDEAEFNGSRMRLLAEFSHHEALWVFGYGSLIWNPTFLYAEHQVATLDGYARRFCLWASTGRGSVELPGLWLGLDTGDACTGMAFRLHNDQREHETLMLWRREMVSGAYVPTILPVRIGTRERPTLCLLANQTHRRYAGHLSRAQIVHHIACASGNLGSCRDYLFRLVDKLAEEGIPDPELEHLAADVRRYTRR